MATPLLLHLRKDYPNAKIIWIVGKSAASIVEATHLASQVIVVDEQALLRGSYFAKFKVLYSIWRQIRWMHFDLCITAHIDPRYRVISYLTRCAKRKFWNQKSKRSHAEQYLSLAPDVAQPKSLHALFPKLDLPDNPMILPDRFIVLAPGGAKNILADNPLRRWPIEYYASLLKHLQTLFFQILVIGGPDDAWVRQHFADIHYVDLIGSQTVLQTVSLLKKCNLLITHDCGPLHLGKLAECETIALFGPTMPCEIVGESEKIHVLWGGETLACRPCFNGKTFAPCQNNVCLREISPERVFRLVCEVLNCK